MKRVSRLAAIVAAASLTLAGCAGNADDTESDTAATTKADSG